MLKLCTFLTGRWQHHPLTWQKRKSDYFRLPLSIEKQGKAAAMEKLILLLLSLIVFCSIVAAVFEDQVGKFDW